MKITITTESGDVTLDVEGDEIAEAAELIASLAPQKEVQHNEIEKVDLDNFPMDAAASLTTTMFQTWQFIVAHDNPNGVHISAVGRHFGLTNGAAGSRLEKLLQLGYVTKVRGNRSGRYRAITPR